MPNFPALYATNASANFLLNIGIAHLDNTLKPLVTYLRRELVKQGHHLLTPSDPQYASGIVSLAHETPEARMAELAEQGIIVWGGDGRIRIAVHLYNDAGDVSRVLAALRP